LDAAADPHWGDTGSAWGFSALANTGFAHINQNGFIGGGQVGYNYQWGPSFVIGIEADMQGAGISGSGMSVGQAGSGAPNWTNHGRHDIFFTATGVNNIQAGVDWMGTVRGRLGYLVMPTLLVYATGGLSYGGVHANVQSQLTNVTLTYPNYYSNPTQDFNYGMPTFGVGQRRSQVNVGWNAGGGFEWMFMPNWSVKAEAFYYDLGRLTVGGFTGALDGDYYFYSGRNSNNPAFLNVTSTRVSYQGVVARAGLNYHFNWGNSAPVVAQY
jgi:outer membrane immunogenic protein